MRRGDTIIEVLLAITVFSVVAVGAIMMMNRGVALSQRSLEITLVRQQIDAQADMLRYIHDQARQGQGYQATWQQLLASHLKEAGAHETVSSASECPASPPDRSFSLQTAGTGDDRTIVRELRYRPAEVYAMANQPQGSRGISIQLTRVAGARAYDAYIQACWYSVGLDRPMTTGTIVRLYDPAA